jgi:CheY-like chemotaxis protein
MATVLTPHEDRPPLAILVVDDNAINRDVARARLGQLGFAVDLVGDGQEAIEAASKTSYHYCGKFGPASAPVRSGV